MKKFLLFPALLIGLLLSATSLTSCVATARPAVVVRPRPVYRPHYHPAPVVVVPARRPVIVRPTPRRYYGRQPGHYVHVR